MMKFHARIKFGFLVLISIFIIGSCSDRVVETPEINIDEPGIISDSTVGEGGWQGDASGSFSYLKLTPGASMEPFFEEGMVFYDNMFIYKAQTDKNDNFMYGYMDPNFNILSEPISLNPNVFYNGVAKILTEDGSYIINKQMNILKEACENYVVHGNSLMEVSWSKFCYNEPFMIKDINPETYLVPFRVEPGPDNELSEPLYGFKTLQDAMSEKIGPEEEFVIPPVFRKAKPFIDGLAAVRDKYKWGFIDESGNIAIDFMYDNAISLTHDVVGVFQKIVLDDEGKEINADLWTLLDTSGNKITDERIWGGVQRFNDYGIAVIGRGRAALFDSDGNRLTYWQNGKEPYVYVDGLFYLGGGFYDEKGELVVNRYSTSNFSDGLSATKRGSTDLWGYIDKKGEKVIPNIYKIAQDFSEGYAYVSDGYTLVSLELSLLMNNPGWLIDKDQNEYLRELGLRGISKFNEDGYAIGYSLEDDDTKVYYMIHIENP